MAKEAKLNSAVANCVDSLQNRCHTCNDIGESVQSAQLWLLHQHEQPHARLAPDPGEQGRVWLQHTRDGPFPFHPLGRGPALSDLWPLGE